MEIVEKVLGALANIFEVAAVFAAALVFLTSRESTQRISNSILSAAVWAASNGWLVWLKRASALAYAGFERLYGPREASGKSNFHGYLTSRSLGVSFRLAAIYLTLGVPLVFFSAAIPYGSVGVGEERLRVETLTLLTIIVCTGIAAAFALKKASKTDVASGKINGIVSSLQFGYMLPAFLFLFSMKLYDEYGDHYLGAVIVGMILPICFYSMYRAIKALCSSFGIYVPIGVFIFLMLSFPVFPIVIISAKVVMISAEDRLGVFNFLVPLSLCALSFSCALFLKFENKTYARHILLATFFCLVLILFLLVMKVEESKSLVRVFFDPLDNGFTGYSLFMLPGVLVAMLVSVVYANAICDWISVGVTRYMTLITSKVRGSMGYAMLIFADCGLATFFFATTMAIFVAMTHLCLAVALIPGEKFLSSMTDTIVANDVWMIPNPPLKELQFSGPQLLGQASAAFVKVFALTALLPTLFHMLMIIAFALIKATGRLAHAPAKALSQRLDEAMMGGGGSLLGLHRVVYGGFVFATISVSLAIAYMLFALAG